MLKHPISQNSQATYVTWLFYLITLHYLLLKICTTTSNGMIIAPQHSMDFKLNTFSIKTQKPSNLYYFKFEDLFYIHNSFKCTKSIGSCIIPATQFSLIQTTHGVLSIFKRLASPSDL